MANDAVESKRVVECVQIGGSSLFRDDGFYLGEDPEKGSSQRQQRVILLGTKIVGIVGETVDHDLAPWPRAVLRGQSAHFARLVSPSVADLDSHRDRVFLLRVIGAFGQIEGLVDGPVSVDHEVCRKPAAAARAHAVVHRFEAGA